MKNFLNNTIRRCQQMLESTNRSRRVGQRLLSAGLLTIMLWGISLPANAVPYERNETGGIQSTERYDQIQSEKGGMNNFEAVDPRFDANEDKAKLLTDNAKRVSKQSADPLEAAKEAIGDLKSKADDAASDLVDKVK
ncbi:MAG: YtxH domain-containing protein [Phormidesmis sp.]